MGEGQSDDMGEMGKGDVINLVNSLITIIEHDATKDCMIEADKVNHGLVFEDGILKAIGLACSHQTSQ